MRRIFPAFVTLLLILPIPAVANPAPAPSVQCGARAQVLEMLAAQEQTRRAIGLAGQAVMEVFASLDSTRWTITVTLPEGRMCLLANGVAFEMREDLLPAAGTAL